MVRRNGRAEADVTIEASSHGAPPASIRRLRSAARVAALVTLAASAALAVIVVVFVFRNGAYVVLGVAGFVLALAGGWWVATQRSARRVIGLVAVVVAAVMVAWSILGASDLSWAWFLRLVVSLAVLAIVIAGTRLARLFSLRADALESGQGGTITRPSRPVLLCNPWSGGGKVERFGLPEVAASLGVETVALDHDKDLAVLAREAVGQGADCLGMAGGDGSQALVASIATDAGLPFVCVSAGTRNHFALDLGIDRVDPRKSVHAFHDAIERRVDYATVNDRFFVNNVSLGVYATIVQSEEYRDAKLATSTRLLPELLGDQAEPFDLQFTTPDGTRVEGAFLLQVSNNPYVLNASPDLSQRRSLSTGTLGVIAVAASTGLEAAAAITRTLAGLTAGAGSVYQFTCTEFEVDSHRGSVLAGVDGEALELPTPLRFRIHPGGLALLVPHGNLDAALRRQAREAHVRDLFQLAFGHRSNGAGPPA
jgi:diacylglycerol kinase family enzyme